MRAGPAGSCGGMQDTQWLLAESLRLQPERHWQEGGSLNYYNLPGHWALSPTQWPQPVPKAYRKCSVECTMKKFTFEIDSANAILECKLDRLSDITSAFPLVQEKKIVGSILRPSWVIARRQGSANELRWTSEYLNCFARVVIPGFTFTQRLGWAQRSRPTWNNPEENSCFRQKSFLGWARSARRDPRTWPSALRGGAAEVGYCDGGGWAGWRSFWTGGTGAGIHRPGGAYRCGRRDHRKRAGPVARGRCGLVRVGLHWLVHSRRMGSGAWWLLREWLGRGSGIKHRQRVCIGRPQVERACMSPSLIFLTLSSVNHPWARWNLFQRFFWVTLYSFLGLVVDWYQPPKLSNPKWSRISFWKCLMESLQNTERDAETAPSFPKNGPSCPAQPVLHRRRRDAVTDLGCAGGGISCILFFLQFPTFLPQLVAFSPTPPLLNPKP